MFGLFVYKKSSEINILVGLFSLLWSILFLWVDKRIFYIFFFLFLCFIGMSLFEYIRYKQSVSLSNRLLSTGKIVHGIITGFDAYSGLSNSYVLSVSGRIDDKVYDFKSLPIMGSTNNEVGKSVIILVNPENYSDYYVHIEGVKYESLFFR